MPRKRPEPRKLPPLDIFTQENYIEDVISFIYIHVDFFAAPYLGYFAFDTTAPRLYKQQTHHSGENFQQWATTLPKPLKRGLTQLTYELKSALGNDEYKWRAILICTDLFTADCMYKSRDANNELKELLEEKPALLKALIRCMHKPAIVEEWNFTEATFPILCRAATREDEMLDLSSNRYADLAHIELQKREDFKNKLYNKAIDIAYIYLDYFAQVACADVDAALKEIANQLKKGSDKTDAFLKALLGKNNNDPWTQQNLRDALQALFIIDNKLSLLIYFFKDGENQNAILNWYREHTTSSQKISCQNRLLHLTETQEKMKAEETAVQQKKIVAEFTENVNQDFKMLDSFIKHAEAVTKAEKKDTSRLQLINDMKTTLTHNEKLSIVNAQAQSSRQLLKILATHPIALHFAKPESGKLPEKPTPTIKLAQDKIDLTKRKTTFTLFKDNKEAIKRLESRRATLRKATNSKDPADDVFRSFLVIAGNLAKNIDEVHTHIDKLCKPTSARS